MCRNMKGTIGMFICLTLLGLYPGISYAGWFGITDYADCIFSGLKNVGSDKAVVAVVSACKQQYPENLHRDGLPLKITMPV